MINVVITVSEDTRVVELADMLRTITEAGFAYKMERQGLAAPVVEAAAGLAVGSLAAYRAAVREAQRQARELRREAERRARDEQGLPLPRARFGDWWEQPR